MPQQTKVFRVFASSTFTDMKEERMILQRDVFPKLEKFCEQNGARFQRLDLRWGVNEETQLEQKTLQTCFNEIDRCQKISPLVQVFQHKPVRNQNWDNLKLTPLYPKRINVFTWHNILVT